MIFINTDTNAKQKKEFIAVHHITNFRLDVTKGKIPIFILNIWVNDKIESVSFPTEDERDKFFMSIDDLIGSEVKGYFCWNANEKTFKRMSGI